MLNFWKKKSEPKPTQIIFTIDNSQSNVEIYWSNNDEATLKELSLLLFYINKGFLMQNIITELKRIANMDSSKEDFIINIIKNWDTCYQHDEDNSVVVAPLMAFNHNVKSK